MSVRFKVDADGMRTDVKVLERETEYVTATDAWGSSN